MVTLRGALSQKLSNQPAANTAHQKLFRFHSPSTEAFSLLLLIAQPILFFFPVLVNPVKSIPYDIEGFHLPLIAYVARCVREHILPLWDPYTYCGVPIHSDLQAQLFYPLTWISIVLGNLSASHKLFYWIEWLVPLHMMLAGLFTFWLLKYLRLPTVFALFGGTVYQLSGFFASQAQHLGAVCCAAWLPLVLLCLWKLSHAVTARWTAILALASSLSVLSGSTAATAVVLGAAGMIVIARALHVRGKRWKFVAAVAAGLVLAGGLSAIQLVPTTQLISQSIASERPQAAGIGGGLPLESLASLLAPNYYHVFTPFDSSKFKLNANFTFLYIYCGIVPVVLLFLSPFLRRAAHARLFASLALLSAIWMLGGHTPMYRVVFAHLPSLVRGAVYSEFALMAFCMFVALASAVALQYLLRSAPRWSPWAVVIVTSLDIMHFSAGRAMNTCPGGYQKHDSEYRIAGFPDALAQIQKLLAEQDPPLRIDYTGRDLLPGVTGAGMLKLPTPDGDNPFALKRVIALRRIFGQGGWWDRQLPVNRPNSPILRMLNVGFLVAPPDRPADVPGLGQLPVALETAGVRFYRIPGVLPRFFLVSRLRLVHNPTEAVAYLAHADFDPDREAIVETRHLPIKGPLASGNVHVESYSANRVELRVITSGRAFLASSEVLYPGWRLTVNGKAESFYMTNGAFRGVLLDSGDNRIVMAFWPSSLTYGCIISAFSAVLLLIGLLWPWFEVKRNFIPWLRLSNRE